MKFNSETKVFLSVLATLSLTGLSGCAVVAPEEPAPAPVQAEEVVVAEPVVAQAEEPVEEVVMPVVPVEPAYERDDVIWIQERLQQLGYYDGDIDGSVGSATRSAIEAYQQDQGFQGDGKPTSELREFMWRNGG